MKIRTILVVFALTLACAFFDAFANGGTTGDLAFHGVDSSVSGLAAIETMPIRETYIANYQQHDTAVRRPWASVPGQASRSVKVRGKPKIAGFKGINGDHHARADL